MLDFKNYRQKSEETSKFHSNQPGRNLSTPLIEKHLPRSSGIASKL